MGDTEARAIRVPDGPEHQRHWAAPGRRANRAWAAMQQLAAASEQTL